MVIRHRSLAIAVAVLLPGTPAATHAQETLDRTVNVSGGWVGYTGMLYASIPYRFSTADQGGGAITGIPTFDISMGIPWNSLVGARFAHGSPSVAGRGEEWELFGRHQAFGQARGAPLDVSLGAGINGAARSLDGELSLARWMGPVRVLGAVRALSDGYRVGEARVAVAGGAVLHPREGSLPIAAAVDFGSLLDRDAGERAAWSAAVQIGAAFTNHTLSLFATNTSTSTVQGSSRGDDRVRYGFELTIPIPAGRFVGWYVPREQARVAVVEEPADVGRVVRAQAARYLFLPRRITIAAGTTVEWTNTDQVVHTVTAEDGSWNSGAVQPGETFRARFDRPGIYLYYCSPHPFMKGVVEVR